MSDVDPPANAGRLAQMGEEKEAFIDLTARTRTGVAAPGTPDGNEILAWLAGNRLRIRDGKGDMRPRGRGGESAADGILSVDRPDDTVEAARKRSAVLADLRRDAPKDPRVQSVFEADPIVAEDPSSAIVVTSRMLRARTDVFDAVLVMLGRPVLTRAARSWMAVHLSNAFEVLTPEAQGEWALSEMRLEETKSFLGSRAQGELNALGKQVEAIMDARDLWDAARAFSIAAHMSVGDGKGSALIPDLLELRDLDDGD